MSLRCTNLMTLTSDVSVAGCFATLLDGFGYSYGDVSFWCTRKPVTECNCQPPVFLHSLNSSQYESKEPTHVLSVGLFIKTHALSVGLFIKTHVLSVGSLSRLMRCLLDLYHLRPTQSFSKHTPQLLGFRNHTHRMCPFAFTTRI